MTRWLLEVTLLLGGAVLVTTAGTSFLIPVLIVLCAATVIVALASGNTRLRLEWAAMAGLALTVAFPFKRIDSPNPAIITCSIALVLFGVIGSWTPGRVPRGTIVVIAFSGILGFSTVLQSDVPSLIRLLPFIASSIPIFALLGRADGPSRARVGRFVVLLGLAESVLAIAEPFALPRHLWAPAEVGALGQTLPLDNPLLGAAYERSQGTLGHPLALSFLLVVALALAVRAVAAKFRPVRFLVVVVLLLGMVASGSRNSLLIALLVVVFFGVTRLRAPRLLIGALFVGAIVAIGIETSVISPELQSEFLDSGSFTHRVGAFEAFGRLLTDQGPVQVLLGNGAASTDWLFTAGLLQNDNLDAVDNQLVLTMAQGGVVALLVLLGVIGAAVLSARSPERPLLLAGITSLFIFDLFSWPSASILMFGMLGVALQPLSNPTVFSPEEP